MKKKEYIQEFNHLKGCADDLYFQSLTYDGSDATIIVRNGKEQNKITIFFEWVVNLKIEDENHFIKEILKTQDNKSYRSIFQVINSKSIKELHDSSFGIYNNKIFHYYIVTGDDTFHVLCEKEMKIIFD
jgi:hypothetical protein